MSLCAHSHFTTGLLHGFYRQKSCADHWLSPILGGLEVRDVIRSCSNAQAKLISTAKRLLVIVQKPCLDLAGLNQTTKPFSDCRSLEDCRMNIEVLKHCSAMLFLVSVREISMAS
jgi:hypothetical protein